MTISHSIPKDITCPCIVWYTHQQVLSAGLYSTPEWNRLPVRLSEADSLDSFKSQQLAGHEGEWLISRLTHPYNTTIMNQNQRVGPFNPPPPPKGPTSHGQLTQQLKVRRSHHVNSHGEEGKYIVPLACPQASVSDTVAMAKIIFQYGDHSTPSRPPALYVTSQSPRSFFPGRPTPLQRLDHCKREFADSL